MMKPGDLVVITNEQSLFLLKNPGSIGFLLEKFDPDEAGRWNPVDEWMDWFVFVDGKIDKFAKSNLRLINE